MLWSALYLEPGLTAAELAAQYSRHFFGPEVGGSDDGPALLLGLEQNWVGPASSNTAVVCCYCCCHSSSC